MANWKDISRSARVKARYAAFQLKEKNRRAAAANRLRAVIRCEEKAAEKEYLALGRYYYNALRNSDNAIAEAHCTRIDAIQARRDRALESLEQIVQEPANPENSSVAVISGADGPSAVFVASKRNGSKKGTLFHFDRGPIEITVTRDEDTEYDPEDEDSEEIDLSDVKIFDQDPMPEAAEYAVPEGEAEPSAEHKTQPAAEHKIQPAAELDENDSLPFE